LYHFLPNRMMSELNTNSDIIIESHIHIQLSRSATSKDGAASAIESRKPNDRATKYPIVIEASMMIM